MEVDEFFKYRSELLSEAQDETGFFSASGFLLSVLPAILDSKLIESEDYNEAFYAFADTSLKLMGYSVNESGERLIIFLINEESLTEKNADNLKVSQKAYYDTHFNRAQKFVMSAIRGELTNELQDTDGVNFLVSQLASDAGQDDFDTVEFFLITATATVETRGTTVQPKQILFDDDSVMVKFKREKQKIEKKVGLVKKLIDLNFLYSVHISQGNRIPLKVEFKKKYNYRIEAIRAADERFFESYLCILPGNLLADLYRDSGSRMLEKNVRSFLLFTKNGVNSGIKKTIRDEPEKFLAYNNGLTITATSKDIEEEGGRVFITSLTDFQIVNGGQTTATIFFSKKEGLSVDGVKIMAKINIAKQATEDELDELISNISTYSNAQNRVSKVDLKARSKPMVKLKSLSSSVTTPSGQRWFFERAKGELNTLIRRSGSKESTLKKYPKERRFTKEELAKYYTAWGDSPHKVKKGGEKVFREFIEDISGEGKSKAAEIDRLFYENVITRIIMFRGMEKIYAAAKIGNLRAAVIPYSMSVLYDCSDGSGGDRFFNFEKVWIEEKLSQNLSDYLLGLMKLMNDLIKKYATSDDASENSKTKELWDRIRESKELTVFKESAATKAIMKAYTIDKQEHKARIAKHQKKEADFLSLQENIYIQNNGAGFYQRLRDQFHDFSSPEKESLDQIIDAVFRHMHISNSLIEAERSIINKIIAKQPDILDAADLIPENKFQETLDFIIDRYNSALVKKSVVAEFAKLKSEAEEKNIKNPEVWTEIGEQLAKGDAPSFSQLYNASSFTSGTKKTVTAGPAPVQLNIDLMRRMIEWAGKSKALTMAELNYISDYTFGLKTLTPFHEGNIRRHLDTLIKKGFKP